jgi:hypothetical protein
VQVDKLKHIPFAKIFAAAGYYCCLCIPSLDSTRLDKIVHFVKVLMSKLHVEQAWFDEFCPLLRLDMDRMQMSKRNMEFTMSKLMETAKVDESVHKQKEPDNDHVSSSSEFSQALSEFLCFLSPKSVIHEIDSAAVADSVSKLFKQLRSSTEVNVNSSVKDYICSSLNIDIKLNLAKANSNRSHEDQTNQNVLNRLDSDLIFGTSNPQKSESVSTLVDFKAVVLALLDVCDNFHPCETFRHAFELKSRVWSLSPPALKAVAAASALVQGAGEWKNICQMGQIVNLPPAVDSVTLSRCRLASNLQTELIVAGTLQTVFSDSSSTTESKSDRYKVSQVANLSSFLGKDGVAPEFKVKSKSSLIYFDTFTPCWSDKSVKCLVYILNKLFIQENFSINWRENATTLVLLLNGFGWKYDHSAAVSIFRTKGIPVNELVRSHVQNGESTLTHRSEPFCLLNSPILAIERSNLAPHIPATQISSESVQRIDPKISQFLGKQGNIEVHDDLILVAESFLGLGHLLPSQLSSTASFFRRFYNQSPLFEDMLRVILCCSEPHNIDTDYYERSLVNIAAECLGEDDTTIVRAFFGILRYDFSVAAPLFSALQIPSDIAEALLLFASASDPRFHGNSSENKKLISTLSENSSVKNLQNRLKLQDDTVKNIGLMLYGDLRDFQSGLNSLKGLSSEFPVKTFQYYMVSLMKLITTCGQQADLGIPRSDLKQLLDDVGISKLDIISQDQSLFLIAFPLADKKLIELRARTCPILNHEFVWEIVNFCRFARDDTYFERLGHTPLKKLAQLLDLDERVVSFISELAFGNHQPFELLLSVARQNKILAQNRLEKARFSAAAAAAAVSSDTSDLADLNSLQTYVELANIAAQAKANAAKAVTVALTVSSSSSNVEFSDVDRAKIVAAGADVKATAAKRAADVARQNSKISTWEKSQKELEQAEIAERKASNRENKLKMELDEFRLCCWSWRTRNSFPVLKTKHKWIVDEMRQLFPPVIFQNDHLSGIFPENNIDLSVRLRVVALFFCGFDWFQHVFQSSKGELGMFSTNLKSGLNQDKISAIRIFSGALCSAQKLQSDLKYHENKKFHQEMSTLLTITFFISRGEFVELGKFWEDVSLRNSISPFRDQLIGAFQPILSSKSWNYWQSRNFRFTDDVVAKAPEVQPVFHRMRSSVDFLSTSTSVQTQKITGNVPSSIQPVQIPQDQAGYSVATFLIKLALCDPTAVRDIQLLRFLRDSWSLKDSKSSMKQSPIGNEKIVQSCLSVYMLLVECAHGTEDFRIPREGPIGFILDLTMALQGSLQGFSNILAKLKCETAIAPLICLSNLYHRFELDADDMSARGVSISSLDPAIARMFRILSSKLGWPPQKTDNTRQVSTADVLAILPALVKASFFELDEVIDRMCRLCLPSMFKKSDWPDLVPTKADDEREKDEKLKSDFVQDRLDLFRSFHSVSCLSLWSPLIESTRLAWDCLFQKLHQHMKILNNSKWSQTLSMSALLPPLQNLLTIAAPQPNTSGLNVGMSYVVEFFHEVVMDYLSCQTMEDCVLKSMRVSLVNWEKWSKSDQNASTLGQQETLVEKSNLHHGSSKLAIQLLKLYSRSDVEHVSKIISKLDPRLQIPCSALQAFCLLLTPNDTRVFDCVFSSEPRLKYLKPGIVELSRRLFSQTEVNAQNFDSVAAMMLMLSGNENLHLHDEMLCNAIGKCVPPQEPIKSRGVSGSSLNVLLRLVCGEFQSAAQIAKIATEFSTTSGFIADLFWTTLRDRIIVELEQLLPSSVPDSVRIGIKNMLAEFANVLIGSDIRSSNQSFENEFFAVLMQFMFRKSSESAKFDKILDFLDFVNPAPNSAGNLNSALIDVLKEGVKAICSSLCFFSTDARKPYCRDALMDQGFNAKREAAERLFFNHELMKNSQLNFATKESIQSFFNPKLMENFQLNFKNPELIRSFLQVLLDLSKFFLGEFSLKEMDEMSEKIFGLLLMQSESKFSSFVNAVQLVFDLKPNISWRDKITSLLEHVSIFDPNLSTKLTPRRLKSFFETGPEKSIRNFLHEFGLRFRDDTNLNGFDTQSIGMELIADETSLIDVDHDVLIQLNKSPRIVQNLIRTFQRHEKEMDLKEQQVELMEDLNHLVDFLTIVLNEVEFAAKCSIRTICAVAFLCLHVGESDANRSYCKSCLGRGDVAHQLGLSSALITNSQFKVFILVSEALYQKDLKTVLNTIKLSLGARDDGVPAFVFNICQCLLIDSNPVFSLETWLQFFVLAFARLDAIKNLSSEIMDFKAGISANTVFEYIPVEEEDLRSAFKPEILENGMSAKSVLSDVLLNCVSNRDIVRQYFEKIRYVLKNQQTLEKSVLIDQLSLIHPVVRDQISSSGDFKDIVHQTFPLNALVELMNLLEKHHDRVASLNQFDAVWKSLLDSTVSEGKDQLLFRLRNEYFISRETTLTVNQRQNELRQSVKFLKDVCPKIDPAIGHVLISAMLKLPLRASHVLKFGQLFGVEPLIVYALLAPDLGIQIISSAIMVAARFVDSFQIPNKPAEILIKVKNSVIKYAEAIEFMIDHRNVKDICHDDLVLKLADSVQQLLPYVLSRLKDSDLFNANFATEHEKLLNAVISACPLVLRFASSTDTLIAQLKANEFGMLDNLFQIIQNMVGFSHSEFAKLKPDVLGKLIENAFNSSGSLKSAIQCIKTSIELLAIQPEELLNNQLMSVAEKIAESLDTRDLPQLPDVKVNFSDIAWKIATPLCSQLNICDLDIFNLALEALFELRAKNPTNAARALKQLTEKMIGVDVNQQPVVALDQNLSGADQKDQKLGGRVDQKIDVKMIKCAFGIIEAMLTKDTHAMSEHTQVLVKELNLPSQFQTALGLLSALSSWDIKTDFFQNISAESVKNAISNTSNQEVNMDDRIQEFQTYLDDFANAFKVDPHIMSGIIAVGKGDKAGIVNLAQRFGLCDQEKVEQLLRLLNQLNYLMPKKGNFSLDFLSSDSSNSNDANSVIKNTSSLSWGQLFEMFDRDKNGTLEFREFWDLVKFLNVDLTHHKAMEIFARTSDAFGRVDKQGFESAMEHLGENISGRTMDFLGISTGNLARFFILLIVLVIMLLYFVFLGIAAFQGSGVYQSVINSFVPLAAVFGVGSTQSQNSAQITSELKETVKKVFQLIKQTF